MTELKKVMIEVEGFGEFEIREPLFDDIETFFGSGVEADPQKFGLSILKRCIFKDNKRVWDGPVGARLGMKLMALAPQVMELIGFSSAEGKDSQPES